MLEIFDFMGIVKQPNKDSFSILLKEGSKYCIYDTPFTINEQLYKITVIISINETTQNL